MRLLQPFSRMHFLAWLIAAPAVICALGFGAIEAGQFVGLAMLRDDAVPTSLADAIVAHDAQAAYAFVRAGQDPNTPIAFSDHVLTGDRQVMVSPLLLAVATNSDNTVRMLLSFGVRMELPGNRVAACLANRPGHEEIARIIVHDTGPASKVECPDPGPVSVPPLLAPAPGDVALDDVVEADPVSAQVTELYMEILSRGPSQQELASDTDHAKRNGIESVRQGLIKRSR